MILRYRAEALADLRQIQSYIAKDNPAAASAVVARIHQSIERLSLFPHSGRAGTTPETLELVVSGLPYIAVYQVAGEFINVVAVFHAARDRG
jgi:addiction module RelE/StbE family toxin